MNRAKQTLTQAEYALYDIDRWAWAIYTALKHAPTKDDKIVLWSLLNKDQKAALRLLTKIRPAGAGPITMRGQGE